MQCGVASLQYKTAAVGPQQDRAPSAFCELLPVRMWIQFPHTESDPGADVLLQQSGLEAKAVCVCIVIAHVHHVHISAL